jgi:hypothetical protein
MLDGLKDKIISLVPITKTALCQLPLPLDGVISKNTPIFRRRISSTQFPLVCANARTVHKLQGRSIDILVISTWDGTRNWIYVA